MRNSPGRSAEADTAAPAHGRRRHLRQAAAARGVPLATILVTVGVVALTYLAAIGDWVGPALRLAAAEAGRSAYEPSQ